MRKLAVILLFSLASVTSAQEPKEKPITKFKATAPATVKAGEHIVIDASSATGDVFFFYDETVFPKARATEIGKVLVLSSPVSGTYTIYAVSLADKSKEAFTVKVTGGLLPPGPDPVPGDPVESLRQEMRKGFAEFDARLRALETKPTQPKAKSLTFVVIGPTAKTAQITEDVAFRAWLRENGVGIYGISTKAQLDANPKFAGMPTHSIVLQDQDNNVIASKILAEINTVADAKAFVTPYLGK